MSSALLLLTASVALLAHGLYSARQYTALYRAASGGGGGGAPASSVSLPLDVLLECALAVALAIAGATLAALPRLTPVYASLPAATAASHRLFSRRYEFAPCPAAAPQRLAAAPGGGGGGGGGGAAPAPAAIEPSKSE